MDKDTGVLSQFFMGPWTVLKMNRTLSKSSGSNMNQQSLQILQSFLFIFLHWLCTQRAHIHSTVSHTVLDNKPISVGDTLIYLREGHNDVVKVMKIVHPGSGFP